MKKMASLIWVPLLLNSCFTVNHKNNYFVAGQFEAVEGEGEYPKCCVFDLIRLRSVYPGGMDP